MVRTLRTLLMLMGAVIFAIASSIVFFGAQNVGGAFGQVFAFAFDPPLPFAGASVDADSELRFYSVFFAAYGAGLFWLGQQFPHHQGWVPAGLALFFVGGIARGFSAVALGWPHGFFVALLVVELVLPPVLYLIYRRAIR